MSERRAQLAVVYGAPHVRWTDKAGGGVICDIEVLRFQRWRAIPTIHKLA